MSREIESYIRAGYPAIVLNTAEEDRALRLCKNIAKSLKKDFTFWSITKGIQKKIKNYDEMTMANLKEELKLEIGDKKNLLLDPVKVLEEALKVNQTNGGIYVLLDFHPFMKTPNVWRRAKDLFKLAKSRGITYVFVSAEFEVCTELKREVIITTLPLPNRAELTEIVEKMAKLFGIPVPDNTATLVEAALGLTINEAENAYATSLAKNNCFDVMTVNKVKEKTICNGGLIECQSSNATLESIGGLKHLTGWAQKRLLAFSPEAKEFGIPAPKGILLVGVPGSGKSLSSKALANLWQKPLLKLDIGKLFGSLVGQTESNTRQALQIAESMAPCILWIDEIEKGLAGIQSSGRTDSGVTSRAFGTILTWLQEKESSVFVIATANNVSELPPEFLRKGRFDEIFFVDIPSQEERKEIFEIQLKKYKRDPSNFDIAALANASNNFTGAEIEQAVVDALYEAWDSPKKLLTTELLKAAIKNINPMATSGSMSTQIANIRTWATEAQIKRANVTSDADAITVESVGRVILKEENHNEPL